MPEIIIREYTPEDQAGILKCIFELQTDEHERSPHYWAKPTETLARNYLEHTLKTIGGRDDVKIFVGLIGDEFAGWIVVCVATEDGPDVVLKKYGYVSEAAVLKEFHGRGVGESLMHQAEEFVKSMGLDWMELNVSEGNKALGFYSKLGYKVKSLRMEKKLNL